MCLLGGDVMTDTQCAMTRRRINQVTTRVRGRDRTHKEMEMTMYFGPLLEQAAATPGIRSTFTAYYGELLNNPMCAELFDRESKCLEPSAIQMALDLISVEYVIRTINSKYKPPAQRYKDQMTKIMQVRPESFKIARQLADSVMMRAGC